MTGCDSPGKWAMRSGPSFRSILILETYTTSDIADLPAAFDLKHANTSTALETKNFRFSRREFVSRIAHAGLLLDGHISRVSGCEGPVARLPQVIRTQPIYLLTMPTRTPRLVGQPLRSAHRSSHRW